MPYDLPYKHLYSEETPARKSGEIRPTQFEPPVTTSRGCLYQKCIKVLPIHFNYDEMGGMKLDKVTEIMNEISEKIEDVSELVEKVSDSELVKFAGDAFKLVDTAVKINNFVIQKRFESCLRGFTEETPTEKQLEKLKKYIDSPERAEFISDSFRKVILSNSSKASMAIGTIINQVVIDQQTLSYEKLASLNALSQFYDLDIDNFKLLREYVDFVPKRKIRIPNLEGKIKLDFHIRYLKEFCQENELSHSAMLYTLEKAVNLQLITKELEPEIDISIDAEYDAADVNSHSINEVYKFNNIGLELLKILSRIERNQ